MMQVYVIGESGILEELDLKGIPYLGGPEDATKVVKLQKGEYMEHDTEVTRAGRPEGKEGLGLVGRGKEGRQGKVCRGYAYEEGVGIRALGQCVCGGVGEGGRKRNT